jgi:hypothetical protein
MSMNVLPGFTILWNSDFSITQTVSRTSSLAPGPSCFKLSKAAWKLYRIRLFPCTLSMTSNSFGFGTKTARHASELHSPGRKSSYTSLSEALKVSTSFARYAFNVLCTTRLSGLNVSNWCIVHREEYRTHQLSVVEIVNNPVRHFRSKLIVLDIGTERVMKVAIDNRIAITKSVFAVANTTAVVDKDLQIFVFCDFVRFSLRSCLGKANGGHGRNSEVYVDCRKYNQFVCEN